MNTHAARHAGQGATACAHTPTEAPQEPPRPPSDPFLDPWRTCRSDRAQQVLELISQRLANHEQQTAPRTRARRHDDQVRWREMTEAVVSALALQVLKAGGRLAVPLSRRMDLPGNYARPTQSARLGYFLGLLEGSGMVTLEKGRRAGMATTITPTPLFADLMFAHGLTWADFGHRDTREVVVLRASTRDGEKRVKRLVDYPETAETKLLRTTVRLRNLDLALADIRYVGNGEEVDVHDRQLRRHFTTFDRADIRFDQGGRWFGGFWQKMKKEDRKHIRINGEPVAEVDFSAAFTHLAFAEMGKTPPAVDDLYAIPGLERLGRAQVKSALNTFLFDDYQRRTWPEDFAQLEWSDPDTGEVFEGFPPEFTPRVVRKAIIAHYPALGQVLGTGIGFRLMFLESEIMRRVLAELHERRLTGLPLHDALVVPQSVAHEVSALMEVIAKEVTGITIPAKAHL